MKIKSGNRPKKPQAVMYVCNKKKCNPCVTGCHWTSDIGYALYEDHIDFAPESTGLYERIRPQ